VKHLNEVVVVIVSVTSSIPSMEEISPLQNWESHFSEFLPETNPEGKETVFCSYCHCNLRSVASGMHLWSAKVIIRSHHLTTSGVDKQPAGQHVPSY
jgi:hypothetical protein